jgi:hypothetical protein
MQVTSLWRMVFFCSKSSKTFLVDERSQRTKPSNKHIYTQIKFQIVYKIWLMQVSLSYIVLTLDYPITIPSQENSFSLALCLRLNNKSLSPFIIELFFEAF